MFIAYVGRLMRKLSQGGLAPLGLMGWLSCALLLPAPAANAEEAFARQGNNVACGPARFQVLSPTLVRLEYSPAAAFIDAPSVLVVKRDWSPQQFTVTQQGKWLVIETGRMSVQYLPGSGKFTPENLKITWTDEGKTGEWKPSQADPQNLGGTLRCMDSAEKSNLASYKVEPGLLSRGGWFLLDDSRFPIWDAQTHWIVPRLSKESQDWYFFRYGQDYKHALEEFSQLAGPVPMLPRYALGYWFGARLGYSPREWKAIVNRFREEGLPLDAVMFDVCTWASHIWSNFDWDPVNIPNPRELTGWLHKQGVRLFVVTHYGPMLKDAKCFKTVQEAMGLTSGTETISFDLSRQRDAQLFTEQCMNPLYDDGLDFTFVDGAFASGMDGLNGQMWTNRTVFEGMEQKTGKRGLIISRTGGWGSHRYPGFAIGDIWSQWEVCGRAVEFITTSGNALASDWAPWIGGFLGALDVEPELFARWTQCGAFSPIAAAVGINGRRLPWEYGTEGIELYRKYMGLRYRLIPYSYTLARQTHDLGLPLQRPLYLEYPKDEEAYNYPHEYLWGPDLLVAPVVSPGGPDGSLLIPVYLPAGNWMDYWTGEVHKGGQVLQYHCPRERLPLFARAGAILPMQPDMAYTDQLPVDPLTLHVYAGAPGRFDLYEDDGASQGYKEGQFAWTRLSFEPDAQVPGRYTLTIGPAKGEFKGQLAARRYRVVIHGLLKPGEVLWNGKALPERAGAESAAPGWSWDGREMAATIDCPETPTKEGGQLVLTGAGTAEDYALARRVALLRLRLRETNHQAKVAAFKYLQGYALKMMPKVMRAIEDAEYKLEALLERPAEIRKSAPDLAAMVHGIIPAIMNKPCDVTRYLGAEKIQLTDVIDDGVKIGGTTEFTPQEQQDLISRLFDLRLFAISRKLEGDPGWEVSVRVHYDAALLGPAEVEIQVDRPADWWTEKPVKTSREGEWTLKISPGWWCGKTSPAPPAFPVRAILRWKGGQTQVTYTLNP